MATFKDPRQCFAPLEVVERLLEIRAELGFPETIYLDSSQELADFLDAYGFDIYAFSTGNEKLNLGDYRTRSSLAGILCTARSRRIDKNLHSTEGTRKDFQSNLSLPLFLYRSADKALLLKKDGSRFG